MVHPAKRTDEPLVFSSARDIREALFNPDLSRAFDKRTFAEGNIRERVVSISYGDDHRQRRRLENSIFRRERLQEYEARLFPQVVDQLLPRLVEGGRADLLEVGETLSVVLAARRAGLDLDWTDLNNLKDFVRYVFVISEGSAILDTVGDPEDVRERVRGVLREIDARFFTPSYERRLAAIEAGEQERQSEETDVLTLLIRHRLDSELRLDRDLILRETATYLQAGTHTSGQTVCHTFDLFMPWAAGDPGKWGRLCTDRFFAQRCVQETIRLRPTTPRIKRFAETDTQVGGTPVARGSTVILDVFRANIDPAIFGPTAEQYDPERVVPAGQQPWGLSFGAGPHICIGRTVAAGLPTVSGNAEEHLSGLITCMVQAIARLGVEPDPDRAPQRDDKTARWTRWSSYPVRFTNWRAPAEESVFAS